MCMAKAEVAFSSDYLAAGVYFLHCATTFIDWQHTSGSKTLPANLLPQPIKINSIYHCILNVCKMWGGGGGLSVQLYFIRILIAPCKKV